MGNSRFSRTMYRHFIIHAQCQQVAHRHSKTWKMWHRGRRTGGKGGLFGGNITEKLLPILVTLAGHLEREKRHENTRGRIRLHNNTHAGQEESICLTGPEINVWL